ncbi:reverse transcriptase domain-containing protein [Tanacetum coccineum]
MDVGSRKGVPGHEANHCGATNVNVREKLKGSGMRLTTRTAAGQSILKNPTPRKMKMTGVGTGNLGQKSKGQSMKKIYHSRGDLEDHLKIFQTAAKIERWAMPMWCHMFNSTLIGLARVWFDKLPPESVDSYEALRKAFLRNFSQQKKYIKDPVEIHYIKQKEGESAESFMK